MFLRGKCILNVVLFLVLLIHCPFGTCFLCFLLYLFYLDHNIFRERIALPCMYSIPSTRLNLFVVTVDQTCSVVSAAHCSGWYSTEHKGPASW